MEVCINVEIEQNYGIIQTLWWRNMKGIYFLDVMLN